MTIQLFTTSDRHHLFMNLLERNLIWLLRVLDIPYVSGQTHALLPSTVLAATRHHYRTYQDLRSDEAQRDYPCFLALKYQCQSPMLDAAIEQFMGDDGQGAQVIDLALANMPQSFDRFNCPNSPAWYDFQQLSGYIAQLNRLAKEAQRVGQPIFLA